MPTTILHTIRQGKIGGGESHVLSLVSRLDPKKYRSIVVAMTDGPMIEALKDLGVKSYVIHTVRPFNPLVAKEMNRIIKEENVDLIHAHGTRAASNSLRSARAIRVYGASNSAHRALAIATKTTAQALR